ncbi:MAG: hypothetical protein G3W58_22880 [Pantoea ananatis]|nr:hypothetical protein [Pantoea ananatis]
MIAEYKIKAYRCLAINLPFEIKSRDDKRWHWVNKIQKDAFGDIIFMHNDSVVRRLNPATECRIKVLVNIRNAIQ